MSCNCSGSCCCPDINGEDTVCDCCIAPMQDILTQLIGRTVRIGTTDTSSGDFPSAVIQSVNDFIAIIRQGANTYALPICHVTGVEGGIAVRDLVLIPPNSDEGKGECFCCERPTREFFDSIISAAQVDTIGPAFNNVSNVTVLDTGVGIVKLRPTMGGSQNFYALSTCKIVSIRNFVFTND
ncbi:hypothetical protein EVU96_10945 [Bacillus infantis]|uniref:hypothetical protein n=1 Tax=Bacillus infantis TaxID=324767 RepID=UPI00101BAC73|nr:hypothetical protein [Bacillus infantis]RYI29505.1 hypothetical protein EVU96_10945 [Bacillus infantis]